jgi:hypothetical protein
MRYSFELEKDLESWWKHQDKLMTVMESSDNIKIGDVEFTPWGDKHLYHIKTKNTITYLRTFQSTEVFENCKGEQVYPILDVYVDICEGKRGIIYKKHRVHCEF